MNVKCIYRAGPLRRLIYLWDLNVRRWGWKEDLIDTYSPSEDRLLFLLKVGSWELTPAYDINFYRYAAVKESH